MHDVGASLPDFIRKGDNVTVTIGRNVGTIPMGDAAWLQFVVDVTNDVSAILHPEVTFNYRGQGEWQGVTEDSCSFSFVDVQRTTLASDVDKVLSVLAVRYHQDAIGWSFGAGRLAR